jgi:hypothetical protein
LCERLQIGKSRVPFAVYSCTDGAYVRVLQLFHEPANALRLMNLEGNLVVVAAYDGRTEQAKGSSEKFYRFATGDVGVLSWAMIDSFTYEPRVIWDDDPRICPGA